MSKVLEEKQKQTRATSRGDIEVIGQLLGHVGLIHLENPEEGHEPLSELVRYAEKLATEPGAEMEDGEEEEDGDGEAEEMAQEGEEGAKRKSKKSIARAELEAGEEVVCKMALRLSLRYPPTPLVYHIRYQHYVCAVLTLRISLRLFSYWRCICS